MPLANVPGLVTSAASLPPPPPPASPRTPPPIPKYKTPVYVAYSSDRREEGDATGGIIPYKNPTALIAYYAGLFALVPMLGFPVAFVSIILGIFGLRARRKNPAVKGRVHAWIGIALGMASIIYHVGGIAVIFYLAANPR